MHVLLSDITVDFDRMIAVHGDETRRLTRQSAGILKALVSADGDVVTKDDLITDVWEGRIITEATLSTALKEARRAVGDTGSEQRIIETVHGVGFRLAVPVNHGSTVAGAQRKPPVILVLPFRSLSSADDSRIADGFSEEITSHLTRFRNLRVLSHMTALHIQSNGIDQAEIAKTYGEIF